MISSFAKTVHLCKICGKVLKLPHDFRVKTSKDWVAGCTREERRTGTRGAASCVMSLVTAAPSGTQPSKLQTLRDAVTCFIGIMTVRFFGRRSCIG